MSKVRVKWVDYGKAVGIILMLYGHLNSKWFPALGESIKWIYTFHMPFFFLLSGIFFSDKKDFIVSDISICSKLKAVAHCTFHTAHCTLHIHIVLSFTIKLFLQQRLKV